MNDTEHPRESSDFGAEATVVAIGRVRRFLKARHEHYERRPMPKGSVRMHPDSIHAEYGRLDLRDIEIIIDAAEVARG